MQPHMKNLWNDSSGMVITAEIVIVATVLVLGVIVGLSNLQTGVLHELSDLGNAFDNLSQSYSYQGFRSATPYKIKSWVRGSRFVDCSEGVAGSLQYDCNATAAVVPQPAPVTAPAPAPAPAPANPCIVPNTAPATDNCPAPATEHVAPGYTSPSYSPPTLTIPNDCAAATTYGYGPALSAPVITEPTPVY